MPRPRPHLSRLRKRLSHRLTRCLLELAQVQHLQVQHLQLLPRPRQVAWIFSLAFRPPQPLLPRPHRQEAHGEDTNERGSSGGQMRFELVDFEPSASSSAQAHDQAHFDKYQ